MDKTFELIWIDKFNAAFLKFTQQQKERENEFVDYFKFYFEFEDVAAQII